MPNLSPLINIDALNDIYEIIKDRVINERVYRTDANPDEILGSESLPYTQAYIQNLHITSGGIVSGPSWSIASDGTISVPNGYTIHSNGNLSGIGSLTADDWNVTGDGQAHFNKSIDTDENISADGNLSIAGTTSLTKAITASSTLTVSGLTSLTNVNVSKTMGESGTTGSWYIDNAGLAKFKTSLSNGGSPNVADGWYISSSNVATADQDNYKRTGSTSELGVDRIFTNRISAESIDTNGLTVNGNLEIDPGAEAEGLITPSIKDSGDGHGSLGSGPHYWITTDGNAEFKGVLGYEVLNGEGALSTYTNGPWYITSTGASKFNNLTTTGSLAVQSGNMTVGSVVGVSSTGAWFNPRLTVGQNTLNTSYNLYVDGTANIADNIYFQRALIESSSPPRWSINEDGLIETTMLVKTPELNVTSCATINKATLNGRTTFGGELDATDRRLKIGTITGASNINTSSITVSSVLTSTGTANLNGVTNINGNLTVSSSGTATFNRAVDFNGNIGNGDAWYINSDGSAYFSSFSLANIDTGHIDADSITITPGGSITGNLNGTADLARSINVFDASDTLTYLLGTTASSAGFVSVSRIPEVYVSSGNRVHAETFLGNLSGTAERALTLNVSGVSTTDVAAKPVLLVPAAGNRASTCAFNQFAYSPNISGIGILYINREGSSGSAVRGHMAESDWWWICGNQTASDSGYLEIATFDNGDEPIYVRQRTDESVISKEITLMDASGNTTLRGLTVNGDVSLTGTISADQFRATDGFYVDSAEEYKENIHRATLNATNLLNNVNVVDFNYKSDKDKKKKIGFIADYTDELLATPEHNRMDTSNCIGVLIKAVQELSDRIERLENR